LEEDRVFVSEGIAEIPLPDLDELFSTLPPLDELFQENDGLEQKVTSDLENLLSTLPELPELDSKPYQELPPAVAVMTTPTPELPDLDDLF
jgi:hypothetical protein